MVIDGLLDVTVHDIQELISIFKQTPESLKYMWPSRYKFDDVVPSHPER